MSDTITQLPRATIMTCTVATTTFYGGGDLLVSVKEVDSGDSDMNMSFVVSKQCHVSVHVHRSVVAGRDIIEWVAIVCPAATGRGIDARKIVSALCGNRNVGCANYFCIINSSCNKVPTGRDELSQVRLALDKLPALLTKMLVKSARNTPGATQPVPPATLHRINPVRHTSQPPAF